MHLIQYSVKLSHHVLPTPPPLMLTKFISSDVQVLSGDYLLV